MSNLTKIAIVEDNETMRKMLIEVVRSSPDFRCVCACSTSREALLEIPRHRADVALMDIHLPDESGIACTAQLTQKMPSLQVIMVTIYKETELIYQALKAGACGYILKRSSPAEIRQAIAEIRDGGVPMTSEVARMLVRSFRTAPTGEGIEGLSARETEILVLVAEGLSNKQIADKAGLSDGTVRIHMSNIFKKLHVRCRTEAATRYLRTKGVIPQAQTVHT